MNNCSYCSSGIGKKALHCPSCGAPNIKRKDVKPEKVAATHYESLPRDTFWDSINERGRIEAISALKMIWGGFFIIGTGTLLVSDAIRFVPVLILACLVTSIIPLLSYYDHKEKYE